MIKWFIGWDRGESVAAYVLAHSLQTRSSMPISISFINRDNLRGIFNRQRSELETTEFSISRFLTPYLCQYQGWAVFSDCDMIVKEDPAKLWAWRDDSYAVRVVKHDHQPLEDRKKLGIQSRYEKKNWSSVMLFNNSMCRALTVDYINKASGLELHQFKWLGDEDLIGDLPSHWNYLVGYDKDQTPSLIHYTLGGPWFDECQGVEYNVDWYDEHSSMLKVK